MVKLTEEATGGGVGRWSVLHEGAVVAPDFARTLQALGNDALLEEIELGLGGDDFQAAAREEARRRGLT